MISRCRRRGGRPVLSSVSETRFGSVRSVSSAAEMLTATMMSPDQLIACWQDSSSTHSVIGAMLWLASAMGMNRLGGTLPLVG